MGHPSLETVKKAYDRAKALRTPRESRFDQAMRYAMPGRGAFFSSNSDSEIDDVFDETAIVATQEFASRLQAGIVPNFTRWAKLAAGLDIDAIDADTVNRDLEAVTEFCFDVINASNFPQESAEAFLDLAVTLGAIELEKGTALEPLRFNAIPINELYVNNGPFDKLDQFFRNRRYSAEQFEVKWPKHTMPEGAMTDFRKSGAEWPFIDAVMRDWEDPNEECYYRSVICLEQDAGIVAREKYEGVGSCPIICFRWGKEAGSVWGRGPLMNAMPAIKTVNLVMQMVLENAQLAIAGIYNMDDDGTVNVDTIELVPGTIIPRTPGTRGLEPVTPAGSFQIAGILLDEQRNNIKRALYNDMLGNPNKTPMSATEVAERMADLSRQIGSAFGRLMGEFIFPVMQRVVFILKDLGAIKLPVVNGREVKVTATSPLARAQDQEDIMNLDRLITFVQKNFGPQMVNLFIKGEDATPYVGEKLGVPSRFTRKPQEIKGFAQQVSQMGQAIPGMEGEAGVPGLEQLTANQPAAGAMGGAQGAAAEMPIAANAA